METSWKFQMQNVTCVFCIYTAFVYYYLNALESKNSIFYQSSLSTQPENVSNLQLHRFSKCALHRIHLSVRFCKCRLSAEGIIAPKTDLSKAPVHKQLHTPINEVPIVIVN